MYWDSLSGPWSHCLANSLILPVAYDFVCTDTPVAHSLPEVKLEQNTFSKYIPLHFYTYWLYAQGLYS